MDFLKKIFGGSDAKGTQTENTAVSGSTSSERVEKKDNHDQGHPSGKEGKNVCEFC